MITYAFAVNVPLAPGTYWVLLHNGPTNTIPVTDFYWGWSADVGNSQSLNLSVTNEPWIGNFAEFALELQGTGDNGGSTVPEPGTMLLLGAGLVGMWFVRARQKK